MAERGFQHPVREQGMTTVTRPVKEGDQAPDFTLRSLDGDDVSLSDYRGKRLVLFMWASW